MPRHESRLKTESSAQQEPARKESTANVMSTKVIGGKHGQNKLQERLQPPEKSMRGYLDWMIKCFTEDDASLRENNQYKNLIKESYGFLAT